MHFAFNCPGSCFHFLPIRLNRRQNQDRICLTSTIFTKFSHTKRLQGICLAASRGRGARTPIYGFGDRCSTIELFPYGNPLFTRSFIIARQAGSCQLIFLIFYGFLLQCYSSQGGENWTKTVLQASLTSVFVQFSRPANDKRIKSSLWLPGYC